MRRGFTLSELLVTIAIVAIGVALLVPALQQMQQESRMILCKNNLKQIGIALHNYHETFNTLPPGWVSREGTAGAGPRFGWQVMLSPFLEQVPLFNKINFSSTPADRSHAALLKLRIPALRCSVDATPDENPMREAYGTSNYSGNYGSVAFSRWAPLGLGDSWPGAVDAPMNSDGFFTRNSSVRFAAVTDGLSNTFMAGERCYTSGGGIWMGVTDNAHEDDTLTDASHSSRPNAGLSSWSSRHPGGVHILLGDGAVRFVKSSIDSKPAPAMGVWQKLASRNDGMDIDEY